MYRLGLREKRRFRVCRTRNLGRMQTGLKKPRLYIHHLFGLMQFTVQYCFHVICMYVPKCRDGRHRQISGRFPMSHVDLGHRSHVETSAHVDLGTIGSGLRTTWAKTPGGIQHWCPCPRLTKSANRDFFFVPHTPALSGAFPCISKSVFRRFA